MTGVTSASASASSSLFSPLPPFPLAYTLPGLDGDPIALLTLIIRIVNLAAGEATQTLPPGRTLPTHPRVALSPPLHPIGTGPRVEAVQFGVAALFKACLEGEGTGGTGGDEDVAHFGLKWGYR